MAEQMTAVGLRTGQVQLDVAQFATVKNTDDRSNRYDFRQFRPLPDFLSEVLCGTRASSLSTLRASIAPR